MKSMNELENPIRKYISILYRYGQSYLTKRLGLLNIGSGRYIYLTTLFRKPGISQEELACELKIDKATAAKGIKKLEEAGYVLREVDLSDKRAYKLSLSAKAIEVVPLIEEAANDWEKGITDGLTVEEKQWAKTILVKMAQNACDLR